MEVIELPSSPERPSPEPQEDRAQRRRLRPSSSTDIIEVIDSDDEISTAHSFNQLRSSGNVEKLDMLETSDPSRAHIPGSSEHKTPLHPEEAKEPSLPLDHHDNVPSTSHASHPLVQHIPSSVPGPSTHVDTPEIRRNPIDVYTDQVLEIVPDVLPEHVHMLVTRYVQISKDNALEQVLHILLEDPTYPKVDKKGKGKRKREADDEDAKKSGKVNVDYGDKDRHSEGGPFYIDLALVYHCPFRLIHVCDCVHAGSASYRLRMATGISHSCSF